jgi:hypothetical protein
VTTPTVSDDPEVREAEAERDRARARFDQLDEVWKPLAAQRAHADLHGALTRELVEAKNEAKEARQRAWGPVVTANERLRVASNKAWLHLLEADRMKV